MIGVSTYSEISPRFISSVLIPESTTTIVPYWNASSLSQLAYRKGTRTMIIPDSQNKAGRNSLAVQWLGLCTLTAKGRVQSLVRELRSHKLQRSQKRKKKKKSRKADNVFFHMLFGKSLCFAFHHKNHCHSFSVGIC